jgi:hypothetical protein
MISILYELVDPTASVNVIVIEVDVLSRVNATGEKVSTLPENVMKEDEEHEAVTACPSGSAIAGRG